MSRLFVGMYVLLVLGLALEGLASLAARSETAAGWVLVVLVAGGIVVPLAVDSIRRPHHNPYGRRRNQRVPYEPYSTENPNVPPRHVDDRK